MSHSFNLSRAFEKVVPAPKKAALLQKPVAVTSGTKAKTTARIDNDKVGICPHCGDKMIASQLNISRLSSKLDVHVCLKDRYVAPLQTSE